MRVLNPKPETTGRASGPEHSSQRSKAPLNILGSPTSRGGRQSRCDLPSRQLEVLIVDDQPVSRIVIEGVLRSVDESVRIHHFDDARRALEWAKEHQVDLLVVDVEMPFMDGIEFIGRVREFPVYYGVPIITVTAHNDRRTRLRALEAGATEFLGKPIDVTECRLRCRSQLLLRRQQLELEDGARDLAAQVSEAVRELRDREQETLICLAKAGEYRDEDTGDHVSRMAQYSVLLARAAGMSGDEVETIERAAPLHDIRKIGVPDQILLKPGKLDPGEWVVMMRHAEIGYEILCESRSKFIRMGAEIALSHHEKWNGAGYPRRLAGSAIPLVGRIVCIADVFDALTSSRPYKPAWPSERAFAYLSEQAAIHFDPELVERFVALHREVIEIQHRFQREE